MGECMCKKTKYVLKKINMRGQEVGFWRSPAGRMVLASSLAAAYGFFCFLLRSFSCLSSQSCLAASPPTPLLSGSPLATACRLSPAANPLVLGLPTIKPLLDRYHLVVVMIVVGEESPHVGARLDAATSSHLAPAIDPHITRLR